MLASISKIIYTKIFWKKKLFIDPVAEIFYLHTSNLHSIFCEECLALALAQPQKRL